MSAEDKREKAAKSEGDFSQNSGIFRLWAGMLMAPLAFLLNLQIIYALVYYMCPGNHMLKVHLVTVGFILVAAAGGFISWRNWQQAGLKVPGKAGSITERSRFMGAMGLFVSALFVLLLIAQWIPQFIFHPCHR